MIKRNTGFTLIELLIVLGILGLVIGAASSMFIGMLNSYKQQSKIAETNIEGIIGLELLRQDIEKAGYGLPWVIPTSVSYNEATQTAASPYNDCSGSAPCNPPKAIVTGNNLDFNNTSDYLVIKAANITRNAVSQRWTYLNTSGPKTWDIASENTASTDYVIVLSPGSSSADEKTLVVLQPSGVWGPQFGSISGFLPGTSDPWPRYVYSIYDNSDNSLSTLRMPFNRTDYFIATSTTIPSMSVPARCAPNITGVLVKSMIAQKDGSRSDVLPLLDCVANMQVVYRLDTNGDGAIDTPTDDISILPLGSGQAATADLIRSQLKEIRVYILAHEGQKDNSYTYKNSSTFAGCTSPTQYYVGDPLIGNGKCFDVTTNTHYRWKLYTIVVQPKNLGN